MGNMLDFLEQSFGHDSPRNASTNYHFDVFISMLECILDGALEH